MTESEAKPKWCPMKRLNNGNHKPERPREDVSTFCIASDCMMWTLEKTSVDKFDDPKYVRGGRCGLAK